MNIVYSECSLACHFYTLTIKSGLFVALFVALSLKPLRLTSVLEDVEALLSKLYLYVPSIASGIFVRSSHVFSVE